MYGEAPLQYRQCRNWFDNFRSGDFSLKDEQRSGRPNEVDDDQIKAIIKSDRDVTVQGIEEMLKIPKSIIDRHKFCQKSTGNSSIKHKLFIIQPKLFYRLQSRPLSN